MKTLLLFTLLFLPLAGEACDTSLSKEQSELLRSSERLGAPYNLSYTLAAIRMVESSARAGEAIHYDADPTDPSLGAYQIKETTALEVLHREVSPGSRDWTILRTILLTDDFYNGRAALLHFLDLRSRLSYQEAIAAYNLGEGKFNQLKAEGKHPENWRYTREVLCYVNYFQEQD